MFSIFLMFSNFWGWGGGMFSQNMGLGCFPVFRDGGRGVCWPILGLGGGFGGLGGLGGVPHP